MALNVPAALIRGFQRLHAQGMFAAPKTIHTCALFEDGDELLRNIHIGEHSPKCAVDFFMLCLARSVSHDIIQSGSNMRAEDVTLDTPSPFLELVQHTLQYAVSEPQAEGTGAAAMPAGPGPDTAAGLVGARILPSDATSAHAASSYKRAAVLTRGEVNPAWKLFSEKHRREWQPLLFVPAYAAQAVEARLGPALAGGPGGVSVVTPPSPTATAPASGNDDVPAEWTGAAVIEHLHRTRAGSSPGVVAMECGPTVTRTLYTQRPALSRPTAAGDELSEEDRIASVQAGERPWAEEVEQWVRYGAPLPPSSCPVDILVLSTYTGPMHPLARGEPLVRWEVLRALFEQAGEAVTAPSDDGTGLWTFRFMVRR